MGAQPPKQGGAQHEAARIGGGGSGADPRDAPVEHVDIEQHRANVHRVDEQLGEQAKPHVLAAQQVAQHHIVAQGKRRRPDPRMAVDARVVLERVAAADQAQRAVDQRHLHGQHAEPNDGGQQQGAYQRGAQRRTVPGAVRLRDEAGGTHAQEAEAPEHKAEEQAAGGHTAQVGRIRQVAGHGGIDRAKDRLGQVGEDDRECQRQHAAMPAGSGEGRRCAGSAAAGR